MNYDKNCEEYIRHYAGQTGTAAAGPKAAPGQQAGTPVLTLKTAIDPDRSHRNCNSQAGLSQYSSRYHGYLP